MHRCLQIEEILRIVFWAVFDDIHFGGRALACLARTCTLFHEPAADVLWHSQSSLAALVKCMPSDLWSNTTRRDYRHVLRLTRPINPGDWRRFYHYAPRVKRLGFRSEHDFSSKEIVLPSVYQTLESDRLRAVLLPNLSELEWTGEDPGSFPSIRLFLVPKLTVLKTKFKVFDPAHHVDEILKLLASTCLKLRTLDLSGWQPSLPALLLDNLSHLLSNLVCHLVDLQVLFCGGIRLDEVAFRHLATLPFLSALHVKNEAGATCAYFVGSPNALFFPSLRFTTFPAHDLDHASQLLKLMQAPNLQNLNVLHKSVPKAPEMETFFIALNDQYKSCRLSALQIYHPDLPQGMEDIFEDEEYLVTAKTLAPLRVLDLTELVIEVPVPFRLDDRALADTVASWPRLSVLRLGVSSGWGCDSQITLDGLDMLAQSCPELEHLSIELDANTKGREPRMPRACNARLRTLNLGNSTLDDPQFVAFWLSRLFVKLDSVFAWTDIGAEDEEGEAWFERWRSVQSLVKEFRMSQS